MSDLAITGNFVSVRILFADDHPVPAFKWMPSLLASQYDYRMPVDLYKTLFEDDTTCDKLKAGAFDIVNDLFCRYIQVRSSHAVASAETQAMKKIVTESCPLAYLTSQGLYEEIVDSEDLAEAFNYHSDSRNRNGRMKRLGKARGSTGNEFKMVLFKKADCLFPQSDSIDGRDWTQITITAPTAVTTGGVVGNSGTVLQSISTGITALADTNRFVQERKQLRSDVINTNALPQDVQDIYMKVNTDRCRITSDDIKKFTNVLTTDPGTGTVYEHNFVQFPPATKTFTIYKDGTTFKMLKYFDSSSKTLETFQKSMIKVKKLDGQGFLNMYRNLTALCIEYAIFILPYHLFDPDCKSPMGFVCADPFDNSDSHLHSSLANLVPTWGNCIYQALIYENVLPSEARPYIHNCQGNGFKLLLALAQRFHYKLSTVKALYLLQPSQRREESFDDFVLRMFFYYDHCAWLLNHVNDLDDTLIQDVFIHRMFDSRGLFERVQQERASGTEAQKLQFVGDRFISSIQRMVASNKRTASRIGSSAPQLPTRNRQRRPNFNNSNVRPTSSLNYDAYYDNGYDSLDDDFPTYDLKSVQAKTDWRDPTQVYYQAVYGLDLSDAPQYQLDELADYCNAVATAVERGNFNFNKDRPCAVCGQTGHSFDDCEFLKKHDLVREAFIRIRVALNKLFRSLRDIGPQTPAQLNLLLSRGLDNIETAASVMSVVGSPSRPSRPVSSHRSSNQPTQADINTLLGEGIISINDNVGSLKQLLSSLNATSTQQSAPTQVNGVRDDVRDDASTNSDPSVIDSIASLLASSGKRSDFRFGRG